MFTFTLYWYPLVSFITECNTGQYGYNCNQTCGNCLNMTDCSSINGSCVTGCAAGYYGDLCKKGFFLSAFFVTLKNIDKIRCYHYIYSMSYWFVIRVLFLTFGIYVLHIFLLYLYIFIQFF